MKIRLNHVQLTEAVAYWWEGNYQRGVPTTAHLVSSLPLEVEFEIEDKKEEPDAE